MPGRVKFDENLGIQDLTDLQREKNLGSRVALLPGKFSSVRKVFQKHSKKWIVWRISRKSGRFPKRVEGVQTQSEQDHMIILM